MSKASDFTPSAIPAMDLIQLNPFSNPGALQIAGESIDMTQAKVGVYVIGGTTDHITPWQGCYGTARLLTPATCRAWSIRRAIPKRISTRPRRRPAGVA